MTDCWACCVSSGAALLACHEVHTTDRDGRKSLASSSHKAFSGNRFARKPSRPAPPAVQSRSRRRPPRPSATHGNNLRCNCAAEFSRQRAGHSSASVFHVLRAPFALYMPATPKPFTAAPKNHALRGNPSFSLPTARQSNNRPPARHSDSGRRALGSRHPCGTHQARSTKAGVRLGR